MAAQVLRFGTVLRLSIVMSACLHLLLLVCCCDCSPLPLSLLRLGRNRV